MKILNTVRRLHLTNVTSFGKKKFFLSEMFKIYSAFIIFVFSHFNTTLKKSIFAAGKPMGRERERDEEFVIKKY